jgi:hypothetical protein
MNELRLKFKLHGKNSSAKDAGTRIDHLSLHEEKPEEETLSNAAPDSESTPKPAG